MRVVIVTEYLSSEDAAPYGGVDWRERTVARIFGRGNDLTLVTSYSAGERHESRDYYDVLRVGPKRTHVQRGDFCGRMGFMLEAFRSVTNLRPDIVCGSGFTSWVPAKRAALKLEVPSVAIVHEVWQRNWIKNMGVISGVAGWLTERPILRGFDGYVAVSRATAADLVEIGIAANRIRVITNGVDEEFFDDECASAIPGVPTLLTVSRLTPYKRISDLLESSHRLFSMGIDHRLIVVGEGSERKPLERKIAELGIADTTTFMGRIENRAEFLKLFKSCDVFVLPSTTEGMGMVLAEAMAARIPYVAADIPALRETSFNGKGGYLFEPCNVEALTSSIILAIEKGRTDEGYIVARVEYDWSRIVKSFSSYLSELVDREG